jgi:hypothetical protein
MLSLLSEPSVALANESMADTSKGSSMPPTPARSMASRRRSGAAGQGREGPGEGEGEVELVGWLLLFGEEHHGVLEREQDTGVDIQGQVEVQRTAAALLGMEVDLPDLTKGVGLDEVPLVVYVEPVIDRVILQVRHVSGDVNGCHSGVSLMAAMAALIASRVRGPWMRSDCSRFSTRRSMPCAARWTGSTTGGRRGPARAIPP